MGESAPLSPVPESSAAPRTTSVAVRIALPETRSTPIPAAGPPLHVVTEGLVESYRRCAARLATPLAAIEVRLTAEAETATAPVEAACISGTICLVGRDCASLAALQAEVEREIDIALLRRVTIVYRAA
ncbi:MAG TPA: hypothetical protein VKY65_13085 [Alphaproteobacteria bacterium]|nr:hypothetical protein [Alphaproteobacteria bacterium]